jgi:hypothetical protein
MVTKKGKGNYYSVYRYELNQTIDTYDGVVENPGPYTANRGGTDIFGDDNEEKYIEMYDEMCRKHSGSSHPTRGEDRLGYDDIFCACPTLKDLKNWFKGFNKPLIDIGFNLVEYRVKTFVMGVSGKQCGFRREDVIGKKILA